MGKSKGKSGTKTPKTSSGNRRMSRAKKALMRLKMKIARWKRNEQNPEKDRVVKKGQNACYRSRHNEWNTAGLEKHAKVLEEIIKMGKTKKA